MEHLSTIDPETRATLDTLAASEASEAKWYALCDVLLRLNGRALDEALSLVRERVLAWPASLRRIGYRYKDPTSAWLQPLFDGSVDPRLALVGYAKIEHHIPFEKEGELFAEGHLLADQYGIACALARCLDPTFRPPDKILMTMSEVRSNNGCGGGPEQIKRGDEQRGALFDDWVTEHAADYSNDGAWIPYGLPSEYKLKFGRHERGSGTYWLEVEGPTPAVLQLAFAYGELLRQGKLDEKKVDETISLTKSLWPSTVS